MKKFADKDVNKVVKDAVRRGWLCEKRSNGPHPYRLLSPKTKCSIGIPGTPNSIGLARFKQRINKVESMERRIPRNTKEIRPYKDWISATLMRSGTEDVEEPRPIHPPASREVLDLEPLPVIARKGKRLPEKNPPAPVYRGTVAPMPAVTEEPELLEDQLTAWAKGGFALFDQVDSETARIKAEVTRINRAIAVYTTKKEKLEAQIDNFQKLEGMLTVWTGKTVSEPHTVSEPSTAEEIEASDNLVIDEYIKEASQRPDGRNKDKRFLGPQEFRTLDRADSLAIAIGAHLMSLSPRVSPPFPHARAEILTHLHRNGALPKPPSGDRSYRDFFGHGIQLLKKRGLITGKGYRHLMLTLMGSIAIREAAEAYEITL